jgi:phosphoglycerate dehydrogenase-like enzyme
MTWTLLALPPVPTELVLPLFGDLDVTLLPLPERTQDAVEALLPQADLVLADWSPQLRVEHAGPRACFVQQPSVGYDGVDADALARAGVPLANCRGANTVSVSEWCLSATLALLRRTLAADTAVRAGSWPQTQLGGQELAGRRVGVVGMGPIGQATARLFTAFGCDVAYWSRSRHADAPVPYAELDDLLAHSDVVVLVVALGPQTRGLVDARRLKKGALLVNGARGEVVDEPALLEALAQDHLGGAALDVFAVEPLPADSPLRDAPRVLLSPHMAGSTAQAAGRIVAQATANLRRVLAGEAVVDVVNGVDPLVRRRA